ncbi:DNA repair protein RecO [Mesomycoplasma conjunctivae]|uniref:DNA replication/recombination mediator RecO N-terminal domain-containing protein n=1 Tax=Mesomycoplasma conjunctivae (strain ATCC 25834 / NCTC 10147 / HRC/581) TaxID=572263 RepID=C5J759_MESCH|nr:DNA repair protein RecO [Mesomycoplasma conjunctivae]CAT05322.1 HYPOTHETICAL PROTEIN MCJ_006270 [Mesomycoplasma conjunctivae]VEU66548.1 DNA repair protein RecO [Mesomycoplasma conjunctivae]
MAAISIKGIVIYSQDYKENDQIIKIATPEKIISFIAVGVRKPNSKNRSSLVLATYGEYEIFLSYHVNKLSKLKKGYFIKNLDFQKEYVIIFWNLISKIWKTSYHGEIFSFLVEAYNIIDNENYLAIYIYLLLKWLGLEGLVANLNSCFYCNNNQRLSHFEFDKGMQCILHENRKKFYKFEAKTLEILYWSAFDIKTFLSKIDFNFVPKIQVVLEDFIEKNSYFF